MGNLILSNWLQLHLKFDRQRSHDISLCHVFRNKFCTLVGNRQCCLHCCRFLCKSLFDLLNWIRVPFVFKSQDRKPNKIRGMIRIDSSYHGNHNFKLLLSRILWLEEGMLLIVSLFFSLFWLLNWKSWSLRREIL